jgi:hypothetical protein
LRAYTVPTVAPSIVGLPLNACSSWFNKVQHEVEGVRGGAAVRDRVGEWVDRLEQFDDRAGPAVAHDEFLRRPASRGDAAAHLDYLLAPDLDPERADPGRGGGCRCVRQCRAERGGCGDGDAGSEAALNQLPSSGLGPGQSHRLSLPDPSTSMSNLSVRAVRRASSR